jgi:hypothetical protein
MRLHLDWGLTRRVGIAAILLLPLLIVSALFTPAKPAAAVMSNCIPTAPGSNPGGYIDPSAGGKVVTTLNVNPPGGTYDAFSVDIQTDSNKVVQTVQTCLSYGVIQATFTKIPAGKYMVCTGETCSSLFETNGSDTSVSLDVDVGAAPSVGGNVYVQLNFKITTAPADDTDYGPQDISLSAITSGDADMNAQTDTVTVRKGKTGDYNIKAHFINVSPGDIKACVTSLNICATGKKVKDTNMTIKIDIPADQVKNLIDTSSSGGAPTCGSVVSGTGWFLCPIMTSLAGLSDLMWNIVQSLLTVNPLSQADPIYKAWNVIRNIANVVFVIFFMMIILSQVSGFGIDNYGIKKLLPKIIICAILVNVSFIFIQIAVDLSNIVGKGLYDVIMGMAGKMPTKANFGSLLSEAIAVGSGAAAFGIAAAVVGSSGAVLWLLAPSILMAVLAFLSALVTLSLRQAAIPILAILAPLAFVAYLLPNTEQWFKKWKDLLVTMLMLYPLASIVFAGAQFAGLAIYANGNNFWWHMVGMVVMALPLFSLPFLARKGGAILSAAQAGLTKLAENARRPFTAYAGEKSQVSARRRIADDSHVRADGTTNAEYGRNGRRRTSFGAWRRQAAVDAAGRREARKSSIETDTSRFKSNWAESDRQQMGNGAAATQRALHAKQRSENVGQEAQNRFRETATPIADGTSGVQEMDRGALATTHADRIKNEATLRQGADPTHRALKRAVHGLEQDVQTQTLQISHEADVTDAGKTRVDTLAMANTQAAIDKQDSEIRVGHTAEGQALKEEQIIGGKAVTEQNQDAEIAASNTEEGRRLDVEVAAGKGQLANQGAATTVRLGETARGRQITADKSVLQKQIKHQEADVEHMVSRSAQGTALNIQAVADERVSKTDQAAATEGFLTSDDAGHVQIRGEGRTADATLKTAQDKETQIATEAGVGPDPDYVDDPNLTPEENEARRDPGRVRARAAGMTDAQIDTMQAAYFAQSKSAQATQRAQVVAKEGVEKKLAGPSKFIKGGGKYTGVDRNGNQIELEAGDQVVPNVGDKVWIDGTETTLTQEMVDEAGKGIDEETGRPRVTAKVGDMTKDKDGNDTPITQDMLDAMITEAGRQAYGGERVFEVTDDAIEAAGIDTKSGRGVYRVQAAVQAEGDKREQEEVAQRKTLFSSDVQPDQLAIVGAQKLREAIRVGDNVAAMAAQQILFQTGDKGHNEYEKIMMGIPAGADQRREVVRKLKNSSLAMGVKEWSIALDKHAINNTGDSLQTVMDNADVYRGLSQAQLMGQSVHTLSALVKNGTLDGPRTAEILRNDVLMANLTDEKKEILQNVQKANAPIPTRIPDEPDNENPDPAKLAAHVAEVEKQRAEARAWLDKQYEKTVDVDATEWDEL